jgi:streptogramin lyase
MGGIPSGSSLTGIAVDGSGNLFVTDNALRAIYEVKK